jgi:hypothetical protein
MIKFKQAARVIQRAGQIGVVGFVVSSCAMEVSTAELEGEGSRDGVAVTAEALGAGPFVTASKPYVVSISPEYTIQPLLSSGDRVTNLGDASKTYQMVGIPDGIGAYKEGDITYALFNHELGAGVLSEPVVGEPLNRGAFVSVLQLSKEGRVIAGDRAYDTVWNENTLVGPAADTSNTTPGFVRFCSASLSYKEAGFDRPIYFAGEESSGAATFDGLGGLGIAIFDNELHTMPKFGRFSWENTVAQPKKGNKTVLIGMEDGPAGPQSQLYMYIGIKEKGRNATAMRKNGLDNGLMYVFVSDTPNMTNEVVFQNGFIEGHWEKIVHPENLTDVQLDAAAVALGAFGFIRTEDGSFDPNNPDDYYFVTTGGSPGNMLGRVYHMQLDPTDPSGYTKITVLVNADQVVAAGGDTAVSPDNVDMDGDYIIVNEDGTAQSRVVMTQKGREASVWRFDINQDYRATRIAELNPPGRDANFAVTSGVWETTGIVSVKGFGPKASYLMNIQAHAPTVGPVANTVEDGQLVLVERTNFNAL